MRFRAPSQAIAIANGTAAAAIDKRNYSLL
jgi:hypothetical protein